MSRGDVPPRDIVNASKTTLTTQKREVRHPPSPSARTRRWREERDDVYAWERGFRRERKVLMDQKSWTAHSILYCDHLIHILTRIKYGSERWINRLWRRLCKNYASSDVTVIAEEMRKVMTDPDSSGLYHLFSFQTNKPYDGMCHQRPMIKRFEEHLAFIQSPHAAEYKYKAMRGLGGASSWFLVPIAIAPGVVPLEEKLKEEQAKLAEDFAR